MNKFLGLVIIILVIALGYIYLQKDSFCNCQSSECEIPELTLDEEELTFVTEDYPPFTYEDESGEVTGLATDMVKEIMKKQSIDEEISIMPWSIAYDKALKEKNVVIFSINKTSEREKLFNWVGPIAKSSNVLYAKKGSHLTIEKLEDAKKVISIGVVDDWFSKQHLEKEGFENLVSSPLPIEMVKKLMNGDVILATLTNVTAEDIVKEAGYEMSDLEPVFVVDVGYVYIGISKGTSESIISDWQDDLSDIKADGTFEKIYNKYRPDEDLVDLL